MISENEIPLAKIMRPSFEEFVDFEQFVENIDRDKSLQAYGVIKVVPPAKWKPRKANVTNEFDTLVVNAPIEQNVQGKSGIYELLLIQKKSMKLNDYRKKVECFDSLTTDKSIEEVEDMFWKNIAFSPPLYGADMAGTLFDSRTPWDLNELPGVLSEGLKNPISGVNTPYLYVGSWKTMFGWHKEDMDLYSINFLHHGKPKFWYCLPPSEGKKIEDYAKSLFPEGFSKCKELLRHKTIMMHPYILKQKIPDLKIQKMIQYPGEFVITLGGAYHAGFNWGFNIAEAVNFATSRWLELLPSVSACSCIKDSVKIDKLEFYTNIMLSKYGKNPAIKKICQENGVTKAKLQSRKLEEEEVDSTETADSRGAQTSRRARRPTPSKSKIRLLEEEEKIPEKGSKAHKSNRNKTIKKKDRKEEEEEVEEVVRHRISSRSKKIKKLGEEYDTSDWKKIGRSRTPTKSKKQNQEQRKKKGKANKQQKEASDDLNVSVVGSEEL